MDTLPSRFPHGGGVVSTHWTTVRACAGSDRHARAARERLCRDYWYPLYAYIKRRGHPWHDAEDLTQGFFAQILESPWFEQVDRSRGRFRAFIFASLDSFLRDCDVRKNALKRGGGVQHIPLDMADAQVRYAGSRAASVNAAQVYELEWAGAVIEAATNRLEAEYFGAGKRHFFAELKVFLAVSGDAGKYEAVGRALGTSADTVKVSVHRLRKRYGTILREEVARTVDTADEVAAEILHIREALATKASAAA